MVESTDELVRSLRDEIHDLDELCSLIEIHVLSDPSSFALDLSLRTLRARLVDLKIALQQALSLLPTKHKDLGV